MSALLIRNATVDGQLIDARIDQGRITQVGARVRPRRLDEVIDADGGVLLPGLHDHHIHVLALAAARRSLVIDRVDTIAARHRASPPGVWIRAVGYHEAVHGPLDRYRLDELAPGRPVRVQHQTGTMWILSSAALEQVGLPAHPSGHLLGLDALVRDRVPAEPLELDAVGRQLASYGVTGVTDATPTERSADLDVLAAAVVSGALPQRLAVTGGPRLAEAARPGLITGPVKLVVADHDLPSLDELAAGISAARAQGRAVAVHCVTRVGLALALAAWAQAGGPEPGDRVEHASVTAPEVADTMAGLGLTVVTQPSFVRERGDRYLTEVDPRDRDDLYRCRSLLDSGVAVAGSTDAPFGHPDPWRAIAAAVDRRTEAGAVLGAREAVAAPIALELFLGTLERPGESARRIVAGGAADLCLLRVPLDEALAAPWSGNVAATICAGRLVYQAS